MLIDRLLARFRIQSKVIIFVVPLVLSICAVGFTGLYTTGILQIRMEISNTVLQSLNGFKDVYVGMNRFLQLLKVGQIPEALRLNAEHHDIRDYH